MSDIFENPMKSLHDELIKFNNQLPMIKEEYFSCDPCCDHGYIHVGGLTTENIQNNGMYLRKTAELIQALLHGIHGQVIEVSGDCITTEDAILLHCLLMDIREKFSSVADKLDKSHC